VTAAGIAIYCFRATVYSRIFRAALTSICGLHFTSSLVDHFDPDQITAPSGHFIDGTLVRVPLRLGIISAPRRRNTVHRRTGGAHTARHAETGPSNHSFSGWRRSFPYGLVCLTCFNDMVMTSLTH
jgi:hypothetical protein